MKSLQLFQGRNINPLRVRHGKSSLLNCDPLFCAFFTVRKMLITPVLSTNNGWNRMVVG